jgi:hypothetical protein
MSVKSKEVIALKKTRATYYLSLALIDKIKSLHAATRISTSLLVEEAIEDLLKKYTKEEK